MVYSCKLVNRQEIWWQFYWQKLQTNDKSGEDRYMWGEGEEGKTVQRGRREELTDNSVCPEAQNMWKHTLRIRILFYTWLMPNSNDKSCFKTNPRGEKRNWQQSTRHRTSNEASAHYPQQTTNLCRRASHKNILFCRLLTEYMPNRPDNTRRSGYSPLQLLFIILQRLISWTNYTNLKLEVSWLSEYEQTMLRTLC